jgi:hypothetical protein
LDFYTFIPSNPLVWVLYILLSWRLYQGLSFDIRHSFTETFVVIKCGAFRRDTNIMRWYCLRYLGLILSQILEFDIVSDTWAWYCLRFLGLIWSQILGFDIVSDSWVSTTDNNHYVFTRGIHLCLAHSEVYLIFTP